MEFALPESAHRTMLPRVLAGYGKRLLGPRWTVRARVALRGLPAPNWGNLRRTQPFSSYFGFERGTPIDRYYAGKFFEQHRSVISGAVLEMQMPGAAVRHGSPQRLDTLDIDARHTPTWCCDLAEADAVPQDSYDCFVMPSTLPFLRDLDSSLRHALRIIKPGGHLLATIPLLGQLDTNAREYWRMTADGWRIVGDRVWPEADVTIATYGNCLAATAAMLGLAAEELTEAELDVVDERFPVLVSLHCRKH
jgi:hypothetical protein